MAANEALTGNRPSPVGLDTRDRRRVTAQICRVEEVFVIAFARIHAREAAALPARIAVNSVVYDSRTLEQGARGCARPSQATNKLGHLRSFWSVLKSTPVIECKLAP